MHWVNPMIGGDFTYFW